MSYALIHQMKMKEEKLPLLMKKLRHYTKLDHRVNTLFHKFVFNTTKTRSEISSMLGYETSEQIFQSFGGWACFKTTKLVDLVVAVLAAADKKKRQVV